MQGKEAAHRGGFPPDFFLHPLAYESTIVPHPSPRPLSSAVEGHNSESESGCVGYHREVQPRTTGSGTHESSRGRHRFWPYAVFVPLWISPRLRACGCRETEDEEGKKGEGGTRTRAPTLALPRRCRWKARQARARAPALQSGPELEHGWEG